MEKLHGAVQGKFATGADNYPIERHIGPDPRLTWALGTRWTACSLTAAPLYRYVHMFRFGLGFGLQIQLFLYMCTVKVYFYLNIKIITINRSHFLC